MLPFRHFFVLQSAVKMSTCSAIWHLKHYLNWKPVKGIWWPTVAWKRWPLKWWWWQVLRKAEVDWTKYLCILVLLSFNIDIKTKTNFTEWRKGYGYVVIVNILLRVWVSDWGSEHHTKIGIWWACILLRQNKYSSIY